MSYRVHPVRPLSVSLRDIWERARFGRHLAQAATGFGALAPLMALANPTGGQVVGGQATISNPSANGTVIKQASQNAAINWQQFSVGANQYVQFIQPDSSAVVLNRVIGGNASSIFGSIKANGQVFLVNPNGILFGPGASLDVSGLVASTQDIGIADFMAGHYAFTKGTGAPDASVINQGVINANGGYVVLAGDYVENDGVINAQSGRVLLAAGGGTTLTLDKSQGLISYSIDSATLARLAGVDNAGSIAADGGTVVMTADVANALTATAVNNTGFVAAHSITSRDGVIILRALGGDIDNSGTLDASATDSGVAGGTITLRGNGHTQLEPTSVIDAEGDGAQGGFIELSGHTLTVHGEVNLGRSGSMLIDPGKLVITSGSTAGLVITAGGYVGAKFIDAQLNAGNAVTLVAGSSIVAGVPSGVVGVVPATAIAATGAGNLTIKTGTVAVGAGGSLTNFSPSVCQTAGVCKTVVAGAGTDVFTARSGTINLGGLTINIKGAFTANASLGAVTLGAVNASAIT
ncbi:MAG: filamentous hemagglutinin N-terminal domain-containing protein, partial [Gammaproteobacteria bacterium]